MRLADFDIDPERGFIPGRDPLTALPARFAAWDRLGERLPLLTMAGRTVEALRALPVLNAGLLANDAERRRALLLLAGFANAWMALAPDDPVIPRGVAVPLIAVAGALGQAPISTHATIVLGNWRRLDPDKPLSLENVDTLLCFRGSIDEKWFFLSTLGVELAGAPMIPRLVAAVKAAERGDQSGLARELAQVAATLGQVTAAFMRVRESCDPHIFYHHVRPYLAGWPAPGAVYEGTGVGPVQHTGGSAAQSSLLQAVDAALGIVHPHELTNDFLMGMRLYMPPRHRAFIEEIGRRSRIRAAALEADGDATLRQAYDACVTGMDELRRRHIGLATEYITRQAPAGQQAVGTGGTHFTDFLRQARLETVRSRIAPSRRAEG